jgi:hypothetical protein
MVLWYAVALAVGVAARTLPAEHGCLPNGPASHMPFCDTSHSAWLTSLQI